MKYEEILEVLAPCCSNCRKCVFYSNGEILNHSMKLKELLGSFDNYAERFSKFLPVYKKYPQFKELLELFTQANCDGCRNQTCAVYPDCGVVDPDLKRRWILMNNRAKEIGIEAYCKESMKFPRYRYNVGSE
jgi:hypothetical protein